MTARLVYHALQTNGGSHRAQPKGQADVGVSSKGVTLGVTLVTPASTRCSAPIGLALDASQLAPPCGQLIERLSDDRGYCLETVHCQPSWEGGERDCPLSKKCRQIRKAAESEG